MSCHCPQKRSRTAPTASAEELLAGRLLAEGVAAAVERTGARRLLVVSARRGDGRTHLIETLEAMVDDQQAGRTGQAWSFLTLAEAAARGPGTICEGCRLVIDGPALLDGDGAIGLEPGWLEVVDGVIVVLLAGRTTEAELALVRARLEALQLPLLGAVWNERHDQGFGKALSRLRQRAWSRLGRLFARPAGRAAPHPSPGFELGTSAPAPKASR